MKLSKITITLLITLFCFTSCSKPEDKLIGHMAKAEKIMKDNMDSPADGVDELISYMEKNGPETVKLLLEAGIDLANIDGDGDRDEKLKEIKDSLKTPVKNFTGTSEKFWAKVEADKDAKKRLQEYSKKWQNLGNSLSSIGKE